MAPSGVRPPPRRPASVDVVAAILVFGGLFGFSQLAVGDFVITGSLPAKGPILGVAAILYAVSLALGVMVRMGRGWLGAINLSTLFAVAYLVAFGHLIAAVLGIAHAAAALILWRNRDWFGLMAAWRAAPFEGRPGPRSAATRAGTASGPGRRRGSQASGSRRPSGRR